MAALEGTLFPTRTQHTDNGPSTAEESWTILTHKREMARGMGRRKRALGSRTLADAKPDEPPVAMMVNSSELRAAGFKLKEVLPPELEQAARTRTRGAGLWRLEGMGPSVYVLHVDADNEFLGRAVSECA